MVILVVLLDLGDDFCGFAGFGWMILMVLLDLGDDSSDFTGFGRTTLSRNQLSR